MNWKKKRHDRQFFKKMWMMKVIRTTSKDDTQNFIATILEEEKAEATFYSERIQDYALLLMKEKKLK